MLNLLVSFISLVVLVIGIISMVTPIPGGVFMIAMSVSTLICSSARARRVMQMLRTRYHSFNKIILWLEIKVGVRVKFIGIALGKTRPLTEIL